MRKMTFEEMNKIKVGEAFTVGTVMAILASAIVVIVLYKLFFSSKGTTTIPGGWKFSWN